MDFATSHFGKMKVEGWTLLQHICSHFWAWLPVRVSSFRSDLLQNQYFSTLDYTFEFGFAGIRKEISPWKSVKPIPTSPVPTVFGLAKLFPSISCMPNLWLVLRPCLYLILVVAQWIKQRPYVGRFICTLMSWVSTSHSAYGATSTKLDGVRGFMYMGLLL